MNILVSHNRVTRRLLMFLAMLGVAAIVEADDEWRELHGEVKAGRLLSLSSIMSKIEADYVGQIVEVEFEREHGLAVYEVEMLGKDGQIVEFEVNAVTGEVIGIEGSNVDGMKRR